MHSLDTIASRDLVLRLLAAFAIFSVTPEPIGVEPIPAMTYQRTHLVGNSGFNDRDNGDARGPILEFGGSRNGSYSTAVV
jgi:hypothetical protein